MADAKTNAMRMLDSLGIRYVVYRFDPDDGQHDGVAAAKEMGLPAQMVYKTLLTRADGGGAYVFVVPVSDALDLKRCAKAAGEKRLHMLPLAELLPISGYRRGGCSPVGMKKRYPTFIDERAQTLSLIAVSGGRIGCQIACAQRHDVIVLQWCVKSLGHGPSVKAARMRAASRGS
jgi:Cys-tRNA(Pro)/Cys-tRNA(Cys) deacylase